MDEEEIKLGLFADDLTAFLRNDKSLTVFLDLVENFGKCSGLIINHEKSEIIFLGNATSLFPKGRTIRKVMGGGGGWGKSQKKNSCKGKCQEKKFVQRRRERKKIHAEGRSNCDFYLIYNICQQAC